jgi:hypothetical protein
MNFLAGFLLLWLQEEQAFWMLVYLVEDVLLDYFGRSMIGMAPNMLSLDLTCWKRVSCGHKGLSGPAAAVLAKAVRAAAEPGLPVQCNHHELALLRICELTAEEGSSRACSARATHSAIGRLARMGLRLC